MTRRASSSTCSPCSPQHWSSVARACSNLAFSSLKFSVVAWARACTVLSSVVTACCLRCLIISPIGPSLSLSLSWTFASNFESCFSDSVSFSLPSFSFSTAIVSFASSSFCSSGLPSSALANPSSVSFPLALSFCSSWSGPLSCEGLGSCSLCFASSFWFLRARLRSSISSWRFISSSFTFRRRSASSFFLLHASSRAASSAGSSEASATFS
mmetsp:Transcript_24633/g.54869  ORF Transcript_24633/g.54869 Transcript_24633/m.54869 type:complete len:212 (-) Transcript_24633:8-643(-)